VLGLDVDISCSVVFLCSLGNRVLELYYPTATAINITQVEIHNCMTP